MKLTILSYIYRFPIQNHYIVPGCVCHVRHLIATFASVTPRSVCAETPVKASGVDLFCFVLLKYQLEFCVTLLQFALVLFGPATVCESPSFVLILGSTCARVTSFASGFFSECLNLTSIFLVNCFNK